MIFLTKPRVFQIYVSLPEDSRVNPYVSIETTHGSPQPQDFRLLDGGFADGILLLAGEVRREGTKAGPGQTNNPMQ